MADYAGRIQTLMDEVYAEWQKDENRRKDKREILGAFSKAHQIAVAFGNLNYQVENGGLEQWIYNGYFRDDAEKLIGYLESGAEFDERCKTIFDRIYSLERCAAETGCDRDGYFHDPDEDGETGFIGDMIDCGAFDTWYYERCGAEDWWESVCKIIDKAAGRESVPERRDEPAAEDAPPVVAFGERPSPYKDGLCGDGPHEDDVVDGAPDLPIRVFVENKEHPEYGGFTMPLPAAREKLRQFLDGIEAASDSGLALSGIESTIPGLADVLRGRAAIGLRLDELNCLAAKIQGFDDERETFAAVIAAGWSTGSVAELINAAENIDVYCLQPAFSAKQYGEFLLQTGIDEHINAFERLQETDPAFARYIETIEENFDAEACGRKTAAKEGGVFTEYGYLTAAGKEFQEAYRGPEDIPARLRLWEPLAKMLAKAENIDVGALLTQMCAAGGEHMRDIKDALRTISGGGRDYLVLMNDSLVSVTPAEELYRKEIIGNEIWLGLRDDQAVRTYALNIAGREGGRIAGTLHEIELAGVQESLRKHSIGFSHIDAEMQDGTRRTITPTEYEAMDSRERLDIKSYRYHYRPGDTERLAARLDALREIWAESYVPVSPGEFIARLNGPFMAQSANPQPDMLRVTADAARAMLARNEGTVYRLGANGAEPLAAIDAVKPDLWRSGEFAVRRQDIPSLGKWAERTAADTLRRLDRGERGKSRDREA
jgi:hypothetical protein